MEKVNHPKLINVNWSNSGQKDMQFIGSVDQIFSEQPDLRKRIFRCIFCCIAI